METQYITLAETITDLASSHPKHRYLVAVAGAPGSGKTTLATAVAAQINKTSQSADDGKERTPATVLSMDGFHLPRSTLDALPEEQRAEAYTRRGAPWTFDVKAFVGFMQRLRKWADSTPEESEEIKAPTFSHALKDPVPDGMAISNGTSIIIVEGNYVLLDQDEWRDISPLVDYKVFVDVDLGEARERLARRHVEAGIETTLDDGFRRVDKNDYLNGVLVSERRVGVDVVVRSEREASDLRV